MALLTTVNNKVPVLGALMVQDKIYCSTYSAWSASTSLAVMDDCRVYYPKIEILDGGRGYNN